jgi:hypothetical protein
MVGVFSYYKKYTHTKKRDITEITDRVLHIVIFTFLDSRREDRRF